MTQWLCELWEIRENFYHKSYMCAVVLDFEGVVRCGKW